jgi:hypothetical protein
MSTTDHRDHDDDATLTPEESLALIEATQRETRGALAFSEWPVYLAWGVAWALAFSFTQLVVGGDDAPLGQLPEALVGVVWITCIVGAIAATAIVIARGARGVTGTSERIGKRIALCWAAAFTGFGLLGGLLGFEGHVSGALAVFVVALLYLGQGAVFLDDLMLGTGLWLLVVDVAAVALGPDWFNLVLAVFGAGAFFVAAFLARRGEQRPATSRG